MVRRQLSEGEKRFVGKQIKRMRDELAHLHYLERYNDLMLNEGLRFNYMEKMREFRAIKGQIVGDIGINVQKISKLQEQLDRGVEMKKKPSGVG